MLEKHRSMGKIEIINRLKFHIGILGIIKGIFKSMEKIRIFIMLLEQM